MISERTAHKFQRLPQIRPRLSISGFKPKSACQCLALTWNARMTGEQRDQAPMLVMAGRTPNTESGALGSRSLHIHWGQDTFDQGAAFREYVKWDYELRSGQPVATVLDRALAIATSSPPGPVYLTLPREVLAAPATPRVPTTRTTRRRFGPSRGWRSRCSR